MKPLVPQYVLVRVFLRGVLIKSVATIRVTNAPGHSTCSVSIPWSPVLRLEDLGCSHLAIFYATPRVLELFGKEPEFGASRWPILFEGELTDFSEHHSLGAHQVNLNARSLERRFEQTKLVYVDPSRHTSAAEAAGVNAVTMFMGLTKFDIDVSGALSKTTRMWEALKLRQQAMVAAGATNVAFTSSLMDVLRDTAAAHPYFNLINERYNLTRRFSAFVDPDVINILELDALRMVADKRISALSGDVNMLQVMYILTELMRYNWIHISQPTYREGVAYEPLDATTQVVLQSFEQIFETATVLEGDIRVAQAGGLGALLDPWSTTPLGTFNLLTISKTRLSRRQFVDRVINNLHAAGEGADLEGVIAKTLAQDGYPADAVTTKPSGGSDNAVSAARRVANQVRAEQQQQSSAKQDVELKRLLEVEQSYYGYRDVLREFSVVPQMAFSHPPRCNVILPALHDSFGMQRNTAREITRLLARVKFGGANAGEEWYIAPFSQAFFKLSGKNVSVLTPAIVSYAQQERVRDVRTIAQILNDESKRNKD